MFAPFRSIWKVKVGAGLPLQLPGNAVTGSSTTALAGVIVGGLMIAGALKAGPAAAASSRVSGTLFHASQNVFERLL